MKKIFLINMLLTFFFILACSPETPPQPRSDYEIVSTVNATGITKYHFFLEKENSNGYHLIQGADYLSPSILSYKIGESTTPMFTINLLNDESEYTVGVVMENSQGYYSGLGTTVGTVGVVPPIPGGIVFRKKQ